jgi:hypothetical protein
MLYALLITEFLKLNGVELPPRSLQKALNLEHLLVLVKAFTFLKHLKASSFVARNSTHM